MTKFYDFGRLSVGISDYVYESTSHGPKTWPWWKLIVIHPVRHSQYSEESKRSYGYNIWIYTRWGTVCEEFSIRRKVKR